MRGSTIKSPSAKWAWSCVIDDRQITVMLVVARMYQYMELES